MPAGMFQLGGNTPQRGVSEREGGCSSMADSPDSSRVIAAVPPLDPRDSSSLGGQLREVLQRTMLALLVVMSLETRKELLLLVIRSIREIK
ncbi:hypothetical protein PC116_g24417 [Phytophthora cactorum]|nr:hypothetical protein PC114_g23397 [Phytophthora cactorum]KAG2994479.1 hypothetical protein PC120_g21984 [Phytophthora cactorum]KAG4227191.1 hypothetical protein PC116_g24417 [Phytophthora cactorum]